jgi:pimeloyl-ACP methyl ester carboxylesterase
MSVLATTLVLLAAAPGLIGAAPVQTPVQTEVEANGPKGPLKGTMLSPASGDAPVVLIIPGSGPTDRDGDNPLGVKAAPYRLLAEGLAAKGIATVRIDKRGMFASASAVPNPNDVTIADYAADVHAWIDAIKRLDGHRCVWVLGHSEGGLVALAAAQNPAGVCGLILVSAAGRPLGAILREQLHANPANAPILQDADAAITALEAGRKVDVSTLHPALQNLFAPAVQGFLISALSLDPARLLASYAGPVAIVQGDKDLQVSVADAERLKAADPAARLHILSGVNHVLKGVSSDDRGANLATYGDPSLPLAPGVVDAVAEIISTHW